MWSHEVFGGCTPSTRALPIAGRCRSRRHYTSTLPDRNKTTDAVINEISVQEDRVVISKDTDFYYSHILSRKPRKLLLIRTGNIGVRDLIVLFQRHLPAVLQALETNSLVELDRSEIRVIA